MQNYDYLQRYQGGDKSSRVQYVMSWKRGKLLLYNKYTFHKRYESGGIENWHCNKYLSLRCSVNLKTKGDFVVKATGVHNHQPPVENKDYFMVQSKI